MLLVMFDLAILEIFAIMAILSWRLTNILDSEKQANIWITDIFVILIVKIFVIIFVMIFVIISNILREAGQFDLAPDQYSLHSRPASQTGSYRYLLH